MVNNERAYHGVWCKDDLKRLLVPTVQSRGIGGDIRLTRSSHPLVSTRLMGKMTAFWLSPGVLKDVGIAGTVPSP